MSRALRPLGNGELLDASLRTVRSRFVPLFGVVILFELIHHAVAKALEVTLYARFPQFMQAALRPAEGGLGVTMEDAASAAGMACGYLFFAFLLWQLEIAALTLEPGVEYALPALSPSVTFRRLRPRFLALLGTLTMEAVLLGLSITLGAIPAAAGVLAALQLGNATGVALVALGLFGGLFVSLGAMLMVLLRYVLVPQIVMIEGLSGRAALARSAALMRGRASQRIWDLPKVRGSILILVVQLVTNALVLVVSAPQAIISVASHERGAAPGIILTLLGELIALLGEASVAPFGRLALVRFYFDLRVRREGLDLQLEVRELAAKAA